MKRIISLFLATVIIAGIMSFGINISAQEDEKTVILTFDGNAGNVTGKPSDIKMTSSRRVSIPEEKPRKTGYDFLGWSKNSSAKSPEYRPGDLFKDAKEEAKYTVLYAVWKEMTAQIKYSSSNDTGEMPENQTVKYSQRKKISDKKPTRDGYDFLGWDTDPDAKNPVFKAGDIYKIAYEEPKEQTLYAVWSGKEEHSVKYDKNTSSSVEGMPKDITDVKYADRTELSSNIPKRSFMTFSGWSKSSSAKEPDYFPGEIYKQANTVIGEDITLYAVWIMSPAYFVKYDAGKGKGVPLYSTLTKDGSSFVGELNDGTPHRDGFDFKGWNTKSDGKGKMYKPGETYKTTDSEKNFKLYAIWEKSRVEFTYKTNPEDGGTLSKEKESLNADGKASGSTAKANENYVFVKWVDSQNRQVSSDEKLVPEKKNKIYPSDETFTAVFEKKTTFTVSFDAKDGTKAKEQKVLYGEKASVPATPQREGYTFKGWYTSTEESKLYDFDKKITKKITLYAQWIENSNVVTTAVDEDVTKKDVSDMIFTTDNIPVLAGVVILIALGVVAAVYSKKKKEGTNK